MTRCGQDTKIMFCGDARQSLQAQERTGILTSRRSWRTWKGSMVEYGIEDIVRSGLVKSYLISKMNLGL